LFLFFCFFVFFILCNISKVYYLYKCVHTFHKIYNSFFSCVSRCRKTARFILLRDSIFFISKNQFRLDISWYLHFTTFQILNSILNNKTLQFNRTHNMFSMRNRVDRSINCTCLYSVVFIYIWSYMLASPFFFAPRSTEITKTFLLMILVDLQFVASRS
jgi:hypothetical protein